MGVQTERLNVILFLLTAVSAVLAMKVAGIMLVSALLILPALTALQLSVSFRTTMIAATGFAVGAVFCGILFAFVLNLPAGAMIVVFNIIFLLLVFGIRRLFTGHG
jgi:zinc transport system permease protein